MASGNANSDERPAGARRIALRFGTTAGPLRFGDFTVTRATGYRERVASGQSHTVRHGAASHRKLDWIANGGAENVKHASPTVDQPIDARRAGP